MAWGGIRDIKGRIIMARCRRPGRPAPRHAGAADLLQGAKVPCCYSAAFTCDGGAVAYGPDLDW